MHVDNNYKIISMQLMLLLNQACMPDKVYQSANNNVLRGFVKLEKIQKFEKNSEVGGWVKPQLGFVFFLKIPVFLCIM